MSETTSTKHSSLPQQSAVVALRWRCSSALLGVMLAACSAMQTPGPSDLHLRNTAPGTGTASAAIPAPIAALPNLPPPKAAAKADTYSVSVRSIPVQELLFALARDAKLNIDVHEGISGLVTINAIDQTLPQILSRIAKQIDLRWEMDGVNLVVMPDKPYLRTYQIDFPNMTRTVKSTHTVSPQVATISQAGAGGAVSSGVSTTVTNDTKNDLMESLVSNVTNMLKEEDRLRYRSMVETEVNVQSRARGEGNVAANVAPDSATKNPDGSVNQASGPGGGASGRGNQDLDSNAIAQKKVGVYEPSVSVFANKETGVLIVRATSLQHEKVRQFIDQVMRSAKRQVLIEATIAEVQLSNEFEQGIRWDGMRRILKGRGTEGLLRGIQNPVGLGGAYDSSGNPLPLGQTTYQTTGLVLDYLSAGAGVAATVKLLETFGDVKVLSSPRLSVMNNQTATLKVTDSTVYFEVKSQTTENNTSQNTTVTTTARPVELGFTMNVTPQIGDGDDVTLNVRPSISRLKGFVRDPHPQLTIPNLVPEISTREMESIVKIRSGEIAIMGGLMQDTQNVTNEGVPGLSNVPVLGHLFQSKRQTGTKTELVVFLRPVVLQHPSVEGDFSAYRGRLPDDDFLVGRGFETGVIQGNTDGRR